MVTSTRSGLSVPDWPLSYGMLFPPMVGGVFYEHGHRMVAASVGLLTACLAIWLFIAEKRKWVRTLGLLALSTVVAQGLLGGLTVLFFLPVLLSVVHAVLAQSFFILTILIAYSLSCEREKNMGHAREVNPTALRLSFFLSLLVYLQLILGAWMRHTKSDPFVPTPLFFTHLLGAVLIAIVLYRLHAPLFQGDGQSGPIFSTLCLLDFLVLSQLILGIMTVLTPQSAALSSLHVATGAVVLGVSILLFLRLSPTSFGETKKVLCPFK